MRPTQKPIAAGCAVTGVIIVLLVFAALARFRNPEAAFTTTNVLAKTTQETGRSHR